MPAEAERKTVRLRILGRVQGVGYRAWTAQRAKKLGLTGWVRNLADGTVECLAQGRGEDIQALIAACHAGPPLARVTQVDSETVLDGEIYSEFRQRPTE
ncbi:MAG: acylphosphatase [Rhodospirillaceae bacterium]